MEYLQFDTNPDQANYAARSCKRRKGGFHLSEENSPETVQPLRQRCQANARERDRTHRSDLPTTTSHIFLPPPSCHDTIMGRGRGGGRSGGRGREMAKEKGVNIAFTMLRTLIPTEPKDRKLSKIETLRLASSYISHLGTQLLAGPIEQPCLRVSKQILEDDLSTSNRHQVCTFCIAHKKSPAGFSKSRHTSSDSSQDACTMSFSAVDEQYICPVTIENQMCYGGSLQNTASIVNTDLRNIYF